MEESWFSYKTASKERQQASETSHIFLYTAGYTTSLMLCPCPSIPPKFSLVSGQQINPNWCYWRWPTHHWTTTCWGGGCTKVHGTTVAPCPYVHMSTRVMLQPAPKCLLQRPHLLCSKWKHTAKRHHQELFAALYCIPQGAENISCKFYD